MDDTPPMPTAEDALLGETARVDDGRVYIDFDTKFGKALAVFLTRQKEESDLELDLDLEELPQYSPPAPEVFIPRSNIALNIVIQVVGSRGDVQPFIALGNELQRSGHRVRLATHNVFEGFVRSSNLEFYPIGGDPAELMAYMVKNPGLIPNMRSLRTGEIQKKRVMVSEMLDGCWKACIEPDLVSNVPFVADAIIANPPSFAHIHCAQALGVPLHLMFTMPWSSTTQFPHPLATIRNSLLDVKMTNYLSYGVVEWMTWQGLGDVVNAWRDRLNLEPVAATEGPMLAQSLKIPFTYCWSPALVPKPHDWPSNFDVCGFFFREPPSYTPPEELDAFLRSGPPPIYIGFGSIVIDNPEKLTELLLEAVESAGVRALISRGWSKLGNSNHPDSVFFLDDCPHEWLFQKVTAVVHHGGAGTTACGLLNGRPTTIVPFFGDQPFWGDMVAAAGAGPSPIPFKILTSQALTEAIQFCITPEASAAAEAIAYKMKVESGVKAAVASFHRNLPRELLSCELLPNLPAAWLYKKSRKRLRLSKVAAEILVENAKIKEKDLRLFQTNPVSIENRRWDPVTGGASAALGTTTDMVTAVGSMFTQPWNKYQQAQQAEDPSKNQGKTAAAMAAASAKGLGDFHVKFFKGTMVDIPLAITEGLHSAPKLYGEEVQKTEPVSDWKSGLEVAGKSFARGMYDGLSGVVMQPYEGAKEEGALGFVKGAGKGVMGLVTKTGSGIVGLVAYPGQGITKSISSAVYTKTRNAITLAKHAEGKHLLETQHELGLEVVKVLEAFDAMMLK